MSTYIPARLVRGGRWYVVFYQVNPETMERERTRETYGIGSIKNIQDREKEADLIVRTINEELLPYGWPYRASNPRLDLYAAKEKKRRRDLEKQRAKQIAAAKSPKQDKTIKEALEVACSLHCNTDRLETIRTYTSIVKLLTAFLVKQKIASNRIGDFSLSMANAYLDHCIVDRKVGRNTWNNNLRSCRTIFNTLVSRGYLDENPFRKIPYKAKAEKTRRNFELHEAVVVINHIRENDPTLFAAIILQFACMIRPAELRRLRRKYFDFSRNVIVLPGATTKNKRTRVVTIPDEFAVYLDAEWIETMPGNYYLFGKNFKPHPTIPCGEKTLYNKHSKILKRLVKTGQLEDTTGLTLYSWKDTGITDALEHARPHEVQDQAGHAQLNTTMMYRHRRAVNQGMKSFPNRLIEPDKP